MAASPVDKVFDELGKMSVLDLVELKKKIEEEWGITAAAPVAVAAAGAAPAAGGDGAAAEEEQTAFDVVLEGAGDKKIQVIKVVRAITGPRPEGGQGSRRQRPEGDQGRRGSGRGRLDQGPARRGGSDRRGQVSRRGREAGLLTPGFAARSPGIGCYPER